MPNKITLKGARENNLKNIDIEFPLNKFIVVTGVSGSGKSSLVFGTLHQEAQKRYLENLNSYARQYMSRLHTADFDAVEFLHPTIALEQKTKVSHAWSTVGTLTGLYDLLRLLFARFGKAEKPSNVKINRSLFSFVSPEGACPVCRGLGFEEKVDADMLIGDPSKSIREGAFLITNDKGYLMYSQVTPDVLNQVCNAHGFSIDIPWKDMTDEQKKTILFGTEIIKIPYGKHTLESRLTWTGITARPREEGFYKGIIPVMEQILKRDRNPNILKYTSSKRCSSCGGKRLNPDALNVLFECKTIHDFNEMNILNIHYVFSSLQRNDAALKIIVENIVHQSAQLNELGLGYLTLSRPSATLTGGETQRIRLCSQIAGGMWGVLYLLDEPTVGLHPYDNKKMLDLLFRLRDNGNTVIAVEHDIETMKHADYLIDIGPDAGRNGGEITYIKEKNNVIFDSGNSRTKQYLDKNYLSFFQSKKRVVDNYLRLSGAKKNNLKNINIAIQCACINVVTGVSGAGKSSLVHGIFVPNLKKIKEGKTNNLSDVDSISGCEFIHKIIEVDQKPIGKNSRSNPATYTGIFDVIRDIFAALPESKKRKWSKSRFSFNVKGGRCEACEGAGALEVGMQFLGASEVVCENCNGKRYNEETLEIIYKEKNIADILALEISDAVNFFSDQPRLFHLLSWLDKLGLGYLKLGQSSSTLSGGEAQRIKLATELSARSSEKILYVLDEPTTGLHVEDIKRLMNALHSLADEGHTLVIIEHSPEIILSADHVIDLGPDSGDEGGQLVFEGSVEDLILCKRSKTGIFLKNLIDNDFSNFENFSEKDKADAPIRCMKISTNNLKNIDVDIPVNKITCVTGISGSGKSSFAFDTLYAESKFRYLENYSTFVRTRIGGGKRGNFESIHGLMPGLALSQRVFQTNLRATVASLSGIYDLVRILFSRFGLRACPVCGSIVFADGYCSACNYYTHELLTSSMFSPNHAAGACSVCEGTGVVKSCDENKLITHPEKSLLKGALDGTKTGAFYGEIFGQYTATLKAVGAKYQIDFSIPFNLFDENARNIALIGTGDEIFNVEWSYKRKEREGLYKMDAPWKGFLNYVNEEYERKKLSGRSDELEELMKDEVCPACNGAMLSEKSRDVKWNTIPIIDFFNKSIAALQDYLSRYQPINQAEKNLVSEIKELLKSLMNAGVSYLSLSRKIQSLSSGELQRVRLASLIGKGLSGMLYVLDEPSAGLHPDEVESVHEIIQKLKDKGNTVLMVEHNKELISKADFILDFGLGAGLNGGNIIASGSVSDITNNSISLTGKYLLNDIPLLRDKQNSFFSFIEIKNARANNLKKFDIQFPTGAFSVIRGVSGSGKSSLLKNVLYESLISEKPVNCDYIKADVGSEHVIFTDIQHTYFSSNSTLASFLGLMEVIKREYALQPESKKRKYKKDHFSFYSKAGQCPKCEGKGHIETSLDFLGVSSSVCESCNGLRYKEEILEIKANGLSVAEVLNLSFSEMKEKFSNSEIARFCEVMRDAGLEYLNPLQSPASLSGGEKQRLLLASALLNRSPKAMIFLMDEPYTGLHPYDVEKLLLLIDFLIQNKNTVIVAGNHPAFIKNADFLIELGPIGGAEGGKLMGCGKNQND